MTDEGSGPDAAQPVPESVEQTSPPHESRVVFGLDPWSLAGFSFKCWVLTLVTLGVYSFWARNEVRQRFAAATRVDGVPFTYNGRAIDLLTGFLWSVGLILLCYLAAGLLGYLASGVGGAFSYWHVAPLLAVCLLLPSMVYLGWRYRTNHTAYADSPLRLEGSATGWAVRLLLLGAGMLLSLGVYVPFALRRLYGESAARVRSGHAGVSFSFDEARRRRIFLPYLATFLIYVVILGIGFAVGAAAPQAGSEDPGEATQALQLFLSPFQALANAILVATVVESVVLGLRIGDASFSAKIGKFDLAMLNISNTLISIFSLGILLVVARARTAKFFAERLTLIGELPLAALHEPETPPSPTLADRLGMHGI